MEKRGAHDGMGLLDENRFHSDYERLDTSSPFANTNGERAYVDEVIVISGTIKISP